MKYFIAGYYGFKNFGDELLLYKIIEDISKIDPFAQFFIWSGDPDFTEKFLSKSNAIAINRFKIEETMSSIAKSDVIVMGGGGLIQEYYGIKIDDIFKNFGLTVSSYVIPPMIGKIYNKKIFYWSLGHGPVYSEEGKFFSRWFYSLADIITVRDESSYLQIKELCPKAAIFLDIDPLLDFDFSKWKIKKNNDKILGISLRKWFIQDRIIEETSAALDRIIKEHDDIIISLIPCDLKEDIKIAEILENRISSSRLIKCNPENPFEVISSISVCSWFVGMRLHSLIAAYKLGIPFLGISYDIKTTEFLEKIAKDSLNATSFSKEELYFKLKSLIQNEKNLEENKIEYSSPHIFNKFLAKESNICNNSNSDLSIIKNNTNRYREEFIHFLLCQRKIMLNKINCLEQQLKEAVDNVLTLESEISDLNSKISYLNNKISFLETENNNLLRQKNEIESSNFWQLAKKYYKLRDKTFLRKIHPIYKPLIQKILNNQSRKSSSFTTSSFVQKIINVKKLTGKDIIIFIYPIDWNHILKSRPHHFALEFAKAGYISIFISPNSIDKINDLIKLNENLYLSPWSENFINISDCTIILGSTDSTIGVDKLKSWKNNANIIIYDYLDEISPVIGGNVDFIKSRHNELNEKLIDLICCVSIRLFNEMYEKIRSNNRVIYLPNACEFEHFNIERDENNIPDKIKKIVELGKPIIGYYGSLAEWIDYELINEIAKKRPDWNILLIGVDYDGSIKKLEKLPNINYIGPVDYNSLPQYAIWFDVAMIPFKEGEIAKATSPIKLYEYFALKKVVVYTRDLIECNSYKTPLIIQQNEDAISVIEKAIELSKNKDYIDSIKNEAMENTWKKRVEKIIKVIKSTKENKNSA